MFFVVDFLFSCFGFASYIYKMLIGSYDQKDVFQCSSTALGVWVVSVTSPLGQVDVSYEGLPHPSESSIRTDQFTSQSHRACLSFADRFQICSAAWLVALSPPTWDIYHKVIGCSKVTEEEGKVASIPTCIKPCELVYYALALGLGVWVTYCSRKYRNLFGCCIDAERPSEGSIYKTVLVMTSVGFAVRVRSAGQKYGPTCHQRDRAHVTEIVTLVQLSSLGQHVGVLALAGYKSRKSALTANPIA